MKQKSGHIWLVSLLVVISILLAACVSTPTTPPVIGKQGGVQVVNNTPGINQLTEVSQTVTDKSTKDGLTLNINASVQTPRTSQIPVIDVQPERITQDTVNKIVQTLMQGKQLYKDGINYYTRDEISQEVTAQQAIRWHVSPTDEQTQPSPVYWPKLLAGAPATVTQVPTTSQMEAVNEGDIGNLKGLRGYDLYVAADLDDTYKTHLSVDAASDGLLEMVDFTNHAITDVYTYAPLTSNQQARGMRMSLKQAEDLAQNTLQAIGITGLMLTQTQIGTLVPLTQDGQASTMDQAYGFWFTRGVNGVSTTMDLTDSNPWLTSSYQYERAFLLINDKGVNELNWTSPMRVTGTVSSNAQILPFDRVLTRFKAQFFDRYALSNPAVDHATFTINRITLGLMRVQVKDASGKYMLIPVWDFYGSASGKTNAAASGHTLHSFLTISALDGSTINRSLGY